EMLLSLALDFACFDGTKPSTYGGPDPDRSIAILRGRKNNLSGKFQVLRELAVFPTGEPLQGANPQSPVECNQQAGDVSRWELPLLRLPRHSPDAVEPEEAELRAEPEVAIGCLSDRVDRAAKEPVANPPRGVRVLAEVQRRIEREGPAG